MAPLWEERLETEIRAINAVWKADGALISELEITNEVILASKEWPEDFRQDMADVGVRRLVHKKVHAMRDDQSDAAKAEAEKRWKQGQLNLDYPHMHAQLKVDRSGHQVPVYAEDVTDAEYLKLIVKAKKASRTLAKQAKEMARFIWHRRRGLLARDVPSESAP